METFAANLDAGGLAREADKSIPLITEIQRFCLQDGPGIRTTIFMKGCPLHCPWCHNPETQSRKREIYFYADKCTGCGRCAQVCTTGASRIVKNAGGQICAVDRSKCLGCMKCVEVCLSEARGAVGREHSMEEIVKEAVADLPFFKQSGGGVTLSGGDPLLFPEFSLRLASRLKREGIHVGMETSCFAPWKVILPLLGAIDLFLVDIKSMDAEKHQSVVGFPLEPILKNIRALIMSEANVRLHLPIVPGFNNSSDDFQAYVEFLRPFSGRLTGVDILPYHVYGERKYEFLGRKETYRYKGIKEIPPRELVPFAKALAECGIIQVSIGGMVGMGTQRGLKPGERR
ncbi:MAG: glycyl-radical enzyme activating protein [Syntrophobacteraceae bacterium]|nr:glycyl-radical enzyme activating protein [Syntrophobacteraceae bacterium]